MTFAVASSLYWDEVGSFHRNAADTERTLAWLQGQIGRSTLVSAITNATVASAVAKRRGEGVGPATVNRSVCEPLRAIVRRCVDTWGQAVQPIKWRDHFLKEPQERVREASGDEEAALLASIRGDYAPALRFALMSGCRRAEIVGLRWTAVDFFNKEITIVGKGDRTRIIPMTKAMYALLRGEHGNDTEAVFTYLARHNPADRLAERRFPITMEGFKTEWRRARARSKITNFKFHDTRHTAATRLLRATGNLKHAQKLLGHSTIATTSRYAHVTNSDLRAGMEAADATKSTAEAVAATENLSNINGKVV